MCKITIIGGAGTLGAAIAFKLAGKKAIDEICLIDQNEKLLLNHLMDLENAYPSKTIYKGTFHDLKHSNIVIITAGIPNRTDISSRDEFLEGNLQLFCQIGEAVAKHAPNALIITASNPVDVLNYYLVHTFQFDKKKLIGYTMNDSYRFEWALRRVLKLHENDKVSSPVIGEHGETQVPLFSQVKVNYKPLLLSEDQKIQVKEKLTNWFRNFNDLGINRTTGWTSAVGMERLIDQLLQPKTSTAIGSAVLNGEYDVSGISLGVPLAVNHTGIQSILEWEIDQKEKELFQQSAEKVKRLINEFIMNKIDKMEFSSKRAHQSI